MRKIYPVLMALSVILCSCRKETMPSGVPLGSTSGYLISIEEESGNQYEKRLFEWKGGRVVGYKHKPDEWSYDSESDSYLYNCFSYKISEIQRDKKGRISTLLVSRSFIDDTEKARFCFEYDREGHLTSMIGVPLHYIASNSPLRFVDSCTRRYKWEKGNLVEVEGYDCKWVFTYSGVKNQVRQYTTKIVGVMDPYSREYFPEFLFFSGMLGKGPDQLPSRIVYQRKGGYEYTNDISYELNNDGIISREIVDDVSYRYKYRF